MVAAASASTPATTHTRSPAYGNIMLMKLYAINFVSKLCFIRTIWIWFILQHGFRLHFIPFCFLNFFFRIFVLPSHTRQSRAHTHRQISFRIVSCVSGRFESNVIYSAIEMINNNLAFFVVLFLISPEFFTLSLSLLDRTVSLTQYFIYIFMFANHRRRHIIDSGKQNIESNRNTVHGIATFHNSCNSFAISHEQMHVLSIWNFLILKSLYITIIDYRHYKICSVGKNPLKYLMRAYFSVNVFLISLSLIFSSSKIEFQISMRNKKDHFDGMERLFLTSSRNFSCLAVYLDEICRN